MAFFFFSNKKDVYSRQLLYFIIENTELKLLITHVISNS